MKLHNFYNTVIVLFLTCKMQSTKALEEEQDWRVHPYTQFFQCEGRMYEQMSDQKLPLNFSPPWCIYLHVCIKNLTEQGYRISHFYDAPSFFLNSKGSSFEPEDCFQTKLAAPSCGSVESVLNWKSLILAWILPLADSHESRHLVLFSKVEKFCKLDLHLMDFDSSQLIHSFRSLRHLWKHHC